jgi:Siphovirus ReqiPepy6 Gp37-like protein
VIPSEVQPFRITIYDKAFGFLGWIGNPTSLSITVRWNGVSTASITIPAEHSQTVHMQTPGTRVVIEHDVNWDQGEGAASDWRHLMSGPVGVYTASSEPKRRGTFTFPVSDDWRILQNTLGWPVPGSVIGSQSGSEYDTRTGAAETVAKAFITANLVTRLGRPVTVEATHGWGSTITVASRMDRLADKLFPLVEQAGVGILVRQSGSGLLVTARQPVTHAKVLTEESGAVRQWSLAKSGPDATRVVIGGPNEGTARTFRLVTDATAEGDWGDVIEGYHEATDVSTNPLLDARGTAFLAENAAKTGLNLELADTPGLRYARDLLVGDVVTLDVGGVLITETVQEATLGWDPKDGVTVKPTVGGWDGNPGKKFGRLVAAIAKNVGRTTRR